MGRLEAPFIDYVDGIIPFRYNHLRRQIMASYIAELRERKQRVQADLLRNTMEREEIERRLQALDTLLDWETGSGNGIGDAGYPSRNGTISLTATKSTKPPAEPLRVTVARVLDSHPEWRELDRSSQMHNIQEALVNEQYDFRGKNGFLAVGMALTKLREEIEQR